MSVEDQIDGFVGYFRRQIAYVASMAGDESITVNSSGPETRATIHKKILYSAILDSLAGIRYWDQHLRNEQRILAMLEEHTSWGEGRLVSVPVLMERLKTASLLRDRVLEILSRYNTDRGNSLPLTAFDKPPEDLEPLAASNAERELLAKSKHYKLFYKYRNFIVHEFREPGYAMELFADGGKEPVYHSRSGLGARYRLLYPEGFFRARAENGLASLDRYFRENRINPYDRVKDSGDWFA